MNDSINQYLASVYYTGDGSTTVFTIPFLSLAKYLYIKVDKELISNTLYTFNDYDDSVVFKVAPKLDSEIYIFRNSDAAAIKVDFTENATIKERDLDIAYLANLALIQELYDGLIATGNNSVILDDLLKGFRYNKLTTEAEVYFNNQLRLKSTEDGIEVFNRITADWIEGDLEGNVKGNLEGDVIGNVKGNLEGDVTGDLEGNVTGNVTGDLTGDVTGNLEGNVIGNVTGDLKGNVTGDLEGNVTGDLEGDVIGNVHGNVKGNLDGNVYKDGVIHVENTPEGITRLFFNGEKKLETNKDGGQLVGKWTIDVPVGAIEQLEHDGVIRCIATNYGIQVIEDINLGGSIKKGDKVAIEIDDDGAVTFPNTPQGGYVTLDTEQTITAKKFISQLAINEVTGLSFELKDAIKWYFTFSTDSFTLTKANGLTPIQVDSSNNVKLQSGNKSSFSTITDGIIVYDTEGKSHRVHLGDTGSYLEAFNLKDDKYLALYANGAFAIRCVNDGAVELYYDGSDVFETYHYGTKHSSDMQNGYLSTWYDPSVNNKRGGLDLTENGVTNPCLRAYYGGGVELYNNGLKTFETWSNTTGASGVTVYAESNAAINFKCTKSGTAGTVYATSNPDGGFALCQANNALGFEKVFMRTYRDGAVELNYNNTKVIETVANGISAGVGAKTIHLWGSGGSCGLALGTGGSILLHGTDGSVNLVKDEKVVFVASAVQTGIQKNNVGVFQAYDDGTSAWVAIRFNEGTNRFVAYDKNTQLFNHLGQVGVYVDWNQTNLCVGNVNRLLTSSSGGALEGTWYGTVTPSDIAIKTDVKPLNGLEKLSLLDPIQWDWKDPQYFDENMETIGFSVDSFEQVFPECVEVYDPMANQPMDTDDTDPSDKKDSHKDKPISKEDQERIDYFKGVKGIKKGITSLKMEALLVDAIKELSNKIESLQKEADSLLDDVIKELSNKIESLQKEVDSLKGDKYA